MFTLLLAARRNQIPEGVWIFTVVVAIGKLVHVQRQIFFADMVITSHDAPLQHAPKIIEMGCVDVSADIFAFIVADCLMGEAIPFKHSISNAFVRCDEGHIAADGIKYELFNGIGTGSIDHFSYNHSLTGDCPNDSNLPLHSAASYPFVLVLVALFPANVSFVKFDFAGEFQGFALHSSAPAVTHIPACMVVGAGVFAEDDTMNLQGADSLFADQHQVSHLEPEFQRDFCILKNGVSDYGESVAIAPTTIGILANPIEGASFQRIDFLALITAWATDFIRPSHVGEKLSASLFGGELGIKGINCFHASEYSSKQGGCQYPPNCHFPVMLSCHSVLGQRDYDGI
jgi:hypothetical protein